MSNRESNSDIVEGLHEMARRGESVASMFRGVKARLGTDCHIMDIIDVMRQAFHLSLAEAKPLASLSRNDARSIEDEDLLDSLVMPAIERNRDQWDASVVH